MGTESWEWEGTDTRKSFPQTRTSLLLVHTNPQRDAVQKSIKVKVEEVDLCSAIL